MSQEIVSNKIRKTCEGCGKSRDYELIGVDVNVPALNELKEWRTIIREVYHQGQFLKLATWACSAECVVAADAKIQVPDFVEEISDGIDLSKLQLN